MWDLCTDIQVIKSYAKLNKIGENMNVERSNQIDAILNKRPAFSSHESNGSRTIGDRKAVAKFIVEVVVPKVATTNNYWVSSRDVMNIANLFGYNYMWANAFGDAMGKHNDALNLPSKKVGKNVLYDLSSLIITL